MKKLFVTGLVILLPLVITVVLVTFAINIITSPFLGPMEGFLNYLGIFQEGFLFLNKKQAIHYIGQLLTLLLFFFVTIFIGIMGRWFFIHYFVRLADAIFHRIPLVNKIYKTCKDAVNSLLSPNTKNFTHVVLVPFPQTRAMCIGLVTNENASNDPLKANEKLVSVFIPGTPNPTVGFLLLYRQEELTYLDMKIDEALKAIVSCGIMLTTFSVRPKDQVS